MVQQALGLIDPTKLIASFTQGRSLSEHQAKKSAVQQLMPAAMGGDPNALGALSQVMPELAMQISGRQQNQANADRSFDFQKSQATDAKTWREQQADEQRRRFNEQMTFKRNESAANRKHRSALLASNLIPSDVKTYRALKKAGEIPQDMKFMQWKGEMASASGKTKPNPFRKKRDEQFAKDVAVPWVTGGRSDSLKLMSQLDEVITRLEKGEENLTGPYLGRTPDWIKGVTHPGAIDTRDLVSEVAQRNLRAVLGGQFAQKEGEQLIARAFNETLDEQTNARRVKRLFTQIKAAAEAKDSAVEYVDQHGTLDGWKGKLWTIEDFNPEAGEDKQDQGWTTLPSGMRIRKKQ